MATACGTECAQEARPDRQLTEGAEEFYPLPASVVSSLRLGEEDKPVCFKCGVSVGTEHVLAGSVVGPESGGRIVAQFRPNSAFAGCTNGNPTQSWAVIFSCGGRCAHDLEWLRYQVHDDRMTSEAIRGARTVHVQSAQ